jgi:hypothetical protein
VTGIFEDAQNAARGASGIESGVTAAGDDESRRAFLSRASRVAITTPSTALLVAASARQRLASPYTDEDHDRDRGKKPER